MRLATQASKERTVTSVRSRKNGLEIVTFCAAVPSPIVKLPAGMSTMSSGGGPGGAASGAVALSMGGAEAETGGGSTGSAEPLAEADALARIEAEGEGSARAEETGGRAEACGGGRPGPPEFISTNAPPAPATEAKASTTHGQTRRFTGAATAFSTGSRETLALVSAGAAASGSLGGSDLRPKSGVSAIGSSVRSRRGDTSTGGSIASGGDGSTSVELEVCAVLPTTADRWAAPTATDSAGIVDWSGSLLAGDRPSVETFRSALAANSAVPIIASRDDPGGVARATDGAAPAAATSASQNSPASG